CCTDLISRPTTRGPPPKYFSPPEKRGGIAGVEYHMSQFTLQDLEKRIAERAKASPEVSYTRKLLDRGAAQCAKKFGEEAVETVIAATAESRERLIAESGDLLYHLLIVLHARGVRLAEIEDALAARQSMSGLEEKSSRPRE